MTATSWISSVVRVCRLHFHYSLTFSAYLVQAAMLDKQADDDVEA